MRDRTSGKQSLTPRKQTQEGSCSRSSPISRNGPGVPLANPKVSRGVFRHRGR